MRSYAREVAFCKLYTYIMTGEGDVDLSQFDQDKLTDEDKKFALDLYNGAIDNKIEEDAIVSEYAKGFKLSRIYRLDLAALELALYEMIHTDTPHPIVINEAVGFAKKFSTEKSVSYVNGILASYERGLSK